MLNRKESRQYIKNTIIEKLYIKKVPNKKCNTFYLLFLYKYNSLK